MAPPAIARDDVAAISVLIGLAGGCVLLGVLVAWWAALGLFFALLVAWGALVLRAAQIAHDMTPALDEAAGRSSNG